MKLNQSLRYFQFHFNMMSIWISHQKHVLTNILLSQFVSTSLNSLFCNLKRVKNWRNVNDTVTFLTFTKDRLESEGVLCWVHSVCVKMAQRLCPQRCRMPLKRSSLSDTSISYTDALFYLSLSFSLSHSLSSVYLTQFREGEEEEVWGLLCEVDPEESEEVASVYRPRS